MGFFDFLKSPDKVKAPKMDIGKDIANYVGGMNKNLPLVLQGEAEYRPQFQGLNLGDVTSFLNGTGGQMGLIGQGGQAQAAAQGQLETARGAEFANMDANTGAMRGLLGNLSPEGAAQVARSQRAAEQAYQSSYGMTGQEARQSDQLARESFAARGRINDNGAVASELLGRDDVMARKRQEAMMLGRNAYDQSEAFYSQPGLQMLAGTPASMGMGQGYLGMGLGAIGSGTPQMYDIGAALNMGAAQRQNQVAAASANAQAQASYSAGIFGAIGDLGGAAITKYSDPRLKFDITPTGRTPGGHNTYTFRYKADPATLHHGVMADEVEAILPQAVTEIGGFKAVDYSLIH